MPIKELLQRPFDHGRQAGARAQRGREALKPFDQLRVNAGVQLPPVLARWLRLAVLLLPSCHRCEHFAYPSERVKTQSVPRYHTVFRQATRKIVIVFAITLL